VTTRQEKGFQAALPDWIPFIIRLGMSSTFRPFRETQGCQVGSSDDSEWESPPALEISPVANVSWSSLTAHRDSPVASLNHEVPVDTITRSTCRPTGIMPAELYGVVTASTAPRGI
jgi:hypothetical protein